VVPAIPHSTLPEVSAADRRVLRALGDGTTVAELADREAFSERDMYRQLQKIWLRLGVINRHAAMVRAVKLGLLD
jgi:DNA-binding NarL/FixJ family response regulator